MNFKETLDYLYNRLPMFTRIGAAAYKKDLHNTILLCDAFDHPEQKFRSIHIAGTNGKGSCSHMIAAIFQSAGYKTGLYTSPHLKDFRERIRVNGDLVSPDFVVDFTERSKQLIETIEPSFFELTVVMAFEYFALQKVDIAIIETGLGGRLDSTNVINPELSIITNIGMDHMNILGNSIEEIANEKAGIIKPGRPVVIGETLPETKKIFETKAIGTGSDIIFAEDTYEIKNSLHDMQVLRCELENKISKQSWVVQCDLPGIYQQKNIRTVLTAVDTLRKIGYELTKENVQTALTQVKKLTGLHGRWELIRKNPFVILDVAHNEDGVLQILSNIRLLQAADRKFSIVIGMVKDKELDKVLSLFPREYDFYFTNAHLPRALPAMELKIKANALGLRGEAYDGVNLAIQQAVRDASENDVIIVCGSVFVVGEVKWE